MREVCKGFNNALMTKNTTTLEINFGNAAAPQQSSAQSKIGDVFATRQMVKMCEKQICFAWEKDFVDLLKSQKNSNEESAFDMIRQFARYRNDEQWGKYVEDLLDAMENPSKLLAPIQPIIF